MWRPFFALIAINIGLFAHSQSTFLQDEATLARAAVQRALPYVDAARCKRTCAARYSRGRFVADDFAARETGRGRVGWNGCDEFGTVCVLRVRLGRIGYAQLPRSGRTAAMIAILDRTSDFRRSEYIV